MKAAAPPSPLAGEGWDEGKPPTLIVLEPKRRRLLIFRQIRNGAQRLRAQSAQMIAVVALTPSPALAPTLGGGRAAPWRSRPPPPRPDNRRPRRRLARKTRSAERRRPARYSRCECPSPSS